MGRDNRECAYQQLIELSEKKGYVLFDDIMDSADKWSLPIQDVDWLSNSITTRGILVYDTAPATARIEGDEDIDDYAQIDYDAMFNRVIEIDPSLEPFISEIRNIKPPQTREMEQLKYQVQEKNLYARQRVIEMHLRFAVRIALQRVEQYNCGMEDTLQDACIGLINAVDKYDPDSSGPFGTYASLWILQNITRNQSTQRPTVYYPVHKKETYFAIYPVLKSLDLLHKDIRKSEKVLTLIQNKIGCSKEQAEEVIEECLPIDSLDDVYSTYLENMEALEKYDLCDAGFNERIFYAEDPFEQVESCIFRQEIEKELDNLKSRDKEVIRERYGFSDGGVKTLEEIGKHLGVTRERVRQIEAKTIKKLEPILEAYV
ncbi:RNA polymerase primary sigma factor [Acidaminococcus fermentans]|jgi:RNA polymerase primary sigma factor|uniref:sigma-70 family RNA polymerase sigma factor n=1 Tax=Acidaminococcus TaxID=904 RepID=UPI0008EFC024|nr:sigma-70 family RNA polymerase sigma factor [Acidaminococcus fermentans]SFO76124.1 RNA polymerase primary sigma factor [Acidaminococcus fermentans]